MRKLGFLVMAFLLLGGCGGEQGDDGSNGIEERALSWIERETVCAGGDIEHQDGVVDMELVRRVAEEIYAQVDFIQEPKGEDVWKTSCETWADRYGDCEDHAHATLMAFRDLGFDDDNVWITVYRKANDPGGHTAVVVKDKWGTHWIVTEGMVIPEIFFLQGWFIYLNYDIVGGIWY